MIPAKKNGAESGNGASMTSKRSMAKIGMAASLGTLVGTGLLGTGKPAVRRLHLWAGIALVGFSYWHYTLYPKTRNTGGARHDREKG